MNQIRQGDVLITAVKALPSVCKEIAPIDGRIVLAHGEVTGHAHAIYEPEKVEYFEDEAARYMRVIEEVDLLHEEHAPIHLTPGDYRIERFGEGTQREYHPEALRSVAD